ncbi:MAG: glycosyltransferase family 1 protein [Bacteroidales bacterium]
MRIAVNTRLLLPGKLEGIGWFTAETIKRITRSHPEHDFYFLFDRTYAKEFIFSGNITPLVIPPKTRHPVLWYTWFEFSLPGVLKRIGADLFVSPDGYLSLSSDIASLAVIHDINFMHEPSYNPWLTGRYYRHFFPRFASKAKRIVTVSEYSKNDISQLFGISKAKIDVVYNGAGNIFTPLTEEEKADVKKNISGGCDYFLYAGSFHARKNICGLLEAYDLFRSKTDRNVKLLLAGERMYKYREMDEIFYGMRYKKDVIFTGRMEHPDLRKAYGAAIALVYIPFFEGFGIPVLEAMNCDIPVMVSNRTSLPEVVDNAALIVDPDSINSVAGGLHKLAFDENFRKKLIMRARIRRKFFSWDRTAELFWKSIENATGR